MTVAAAPAQPRGGRGVHDPVPLLVLAEHARACAAPGDEDEDSHEHADNNDERPAVEFVAAARAGPVARRGHCRDAAARAGGEALAGGVGGDLCYYI